MYNRLINHYSNSRVTMELRDVLATVDENGKPFKLWDFDYPSYYKDEAKTAFEQKVIDHYLFHQIGVETIARFKHNFKTRVREIMPYYIQMYKSAEIMSGIEDPFGNIDIVETFEQTTTDKSLGTMLSSETGTSETSAAETGTSETSATETGTSDSTETTNKTDEKTASEDRELRFSNTPQGSISNIDNYLTEATKESKDLSESVTTNSAVTTDSNTQNATTGTVKTSTTTSGTGESSHSSSGSSETQNNGTVKHTLTRKGNQGVNTYAHDMIEFRNSFIDVDMMIIGALRDLFLMIY